MFQEYVKLLKQNGFQLPALVPQVYLHYDPYTWAQRGRQVRWPASAWIS